MPDRARPASRWLTAGTLAVLAVAACGNPGDGPGPGGVAATATTTAVAAPPPPAGPSTSVGPSTSASPSTATTTTTAVTGTTSPMSAPSPTSSAPAETGFHSSVSPVDDALRQRMATSWREGCPVPLTDLRYVTVTHRGFDGADHTGELVVAASVAEDVVSVFHRLYELGYPVASMRLVDDFGGDDDASMAADNTSAFNCRPVTGRGGFSAHADGTAIDLNPVENPYVRGDTVLPPAGADFLSRPDRPGVLHDGDPVVAASADIGWSWGGRWSSPTD